MGGLLLLTLGLALGSGSFAILLITNYFLLALTDFVLFFLEVSTKFLHELRGLWDKNM